MGEVVDPCVYKLCLDDPVATGHDIAPVDLTDSQTSEIKGGAGAWAGEALIVPADLHGPDPQVNRVSFTRTNKPELAEVSRM